MELADRFILHSAISHYGGPSYIQQVIDDGTDWELDDEPSLHEMFHENSKIRQIGLENRQRSINAMAAHPPIRFVNAKDFDGFPSIELPAPDGIAEHRRAEQPVDAQRGIPEVSILLSTCLDFAASQVEPPASGDSSLKHGRNYLAEQFDPVDIYVVIVNVPSIEAGIYYYYPSRHRLYRVDRNDQNLFERLCAAGIVDGLEDVNALAVLVGIFRRTVWLFGERGYRYALLETDMIVERLCSASLSLGLYAHRQEEFVDDVLNRLLGVNGVDESVLYCVALSAATLGSH